MENTQPDLQQPPVVAPQPPPDIIVPPQGKSKKPIVILAVLVLLIIVVATVFFVFYKKGNKSTSDIVPTPTRSIPFPTSIPTLIPTVPADTAIRLNLIKGKVMQIPTTDVTIEYIGASLPNPKCFDCISTTDIALIKKDIKKILSYSCGGIAGKCTDKIIEYKMEVTLENTTDTTAQVIIKKQ